MKRAIYYCARLISAQRGAGPAAHDYALLEKVYSIWLCIDAPPEEQGTIALYSIQEKNLYGSIERPRKDYDLQSAVFVGLPKNCGYNGNEFIRTLAALFSLDTNVDEKMAALERGLGPELAREFKGDAETMGNLTEWAIETGIERGMKQGLEQGVQQTLLASIDSVMRNLSLTVEQAMDALDVPLEKRDGYRAQLAADKPSS